MSIKKVMVAGSGLMGSGIAQVCAQSSIEVSIYDIYPEALEKALKNIEWSVKKFAEKGKISDDPETVMGRIKTVSDLSDAASAGLIIEAVFEKLDVKQEIFKKIDDIDVYKLSI